MIQALPKGYQTVVGRDNAYLSGGEKQRLAIARVFLKDAPIVILDEATAYADAENEAKIQAAFAKLARNKTVLMIAHRLKTVERADQLLVMERGRLVAPAPTKNCWIPVRPIKSWWRPISGGTAGVSGKEWYGHENQRMVSDDDPGPAV